MITIIDFYHVSGNTVITYTYDDTPCQISIASQLTEQEAYHVLSNQPIEWHLENEAAHG